MSAIDEKIAVATANALHELSVKDICVIQAETAVVWAGRALASYRRYAESGDLQELLAAEEFGHEAIEHAALARPALYQTILGYLTSSKEKCGLR